MQPSDRKVCSLQLPLGGYLHTPQNSTKRSELVSEVALLMDLHPHRESYKAQ